MKSDGEDLFPVFPEIRKEVINILGIFKVKKKR